VTPFYTHLNEKGEECGILVNRGWVPDDLRGVKLHYNTAASGEVVGLLYRGDAKTKYYKPNTPSGNFFHSVQPFDISAIAQLKNFDEASKFMIMQIDENPDTR